MRTVIASAPGREMRIAADITLLREAREWAAEVAAELGLDEDSCFQVKLAMSEAVTNAIVHGSASPEDPIELEVSDADGCVSFEVRDRGTKDADYPADRVTEGGRGLELVALMMDEMQLTRTDAGSVLRFAKRLR